MSLGLATDGLYDTSPDITFPVITILHIPATSQEAFQVSLKDERGLSLWELTTLQRTDGPRQVIYDPDDGFVFPFNGRSTITGTGSLVDPFIFTIYQLGGWPTGVSFNIRARAIDSSGNKIEV